MTYLRNLMYPRMMLGTPTTSPVSMIPGTPTHRPVSMSRGTQQGVKSSDHHNR